MSRAYAEGTEVPVARTVAELRTLVEKHEPLDPADLERWARQIDEAREAIAGVRRTGVTAS